MLLSLHKEWLEDKILIMTFFEDGRFSVTYALNSSHEYKLFLHMTDDYNCKVYLQGALTSLVKCSTKSLQNKRVVVRCEERELNCILEGKN